MKSSQLGVARRRILSVAVLLSAPAICGVSRAGAQTASAPSNQQAKDRQAKAAEAEQLFERAAARMDIKDYEAASSLLEQSQALDPSSGTLLNLAECYEQRGLTASAYAAFEGARELSLRTGRTDRAEVAELRTQRLLPKLRRLIIVPPSPYPESLVVQLDGKPLARSRWNQPLPVDPGLHRIEAAADAQPPYATNISAPEAGATTSVSIPPLQPSERSELAGGRGVDGQRVAAIASGVLGVAGLATGTIFGLRSRAKHRKSDEYCGPTTCRERQGVELMEDARSAGNVSTVGFIVGGVAGAAAAVLWFAPPFGKATAPVIGLGPGTLRVAGQW